MLDFLIQIDKQLFALLNSSWTNGMLDASMPIVSALKYWVPLYVLGAAWLLVKGKIEGRWCFVALLVCVGISDPLNSRVLKKFFNRSRPVEQIATIRELSPTHGGKSFPSTHATNNFAAALVLSYFFRRRWMLWFFLASLVAYSRVYVGAHFPADVLAGGAVGIVIASVVLLALKSVRQMYFNKKAAVNNRG